MKVFVSGATGFVGTAVSSAFVRAGHHVRGLTRSKAKADSLDARGIEPVVGSMDKPDPWLAKARECSLLVHCAAEEGARYMELDTDMVETLVACVGTLGAPHALLYTSGVWVYGDTRGERVDESSPLHPPELVAARARNEGRVLSANSERLRTIVIRPGCVYGGSGSLTGLWFKSAKKEGAARFVGQGAQRWAMIHLDDLAELYVRAGESGRGGEVFNATDRSNATVRECAAAASRAAGAEGKVATTSIAEATKRLGPVAECLAFDQHVDSSKAVRLLGWQPRHAGFIDQVERHYASWRALSKQSS